MGLSPAELKVKKDAAVSALYSLHKAAGDATAAVLDLVNLLDASGLNVEELRSAFGAVADAKATPVTAAPATPAGKKAPASKAEATSPSAEAEPEAEDADASGKRKRKRAPKDPNAPKRPLNAFLKFRNYEMKRISEERKAKGQPDLPRPELSTVVKEHWEAMAESEKEKLQEESRAELESYHEKKASYDANNAEPSSQITADEPLSQATQEATQDTAAEGELLSSPTKKKGKKNDASKKEDKKKKKKHQE